MDSLGISMSDISRKPPRRKVGRPNGVRVTLPPSKDEEVFVTDTLALRQEVARRIQAQLDKRGMNPAELGRVLGIHRGTVGHWVKAESLPAGANARALAELFNMSVEDLIPRGLLYGVDSPDEVRQVFKTNQVGDYTSVMLSGRMSFSNAMTLGRWLDKIGFQDESQGAKPGKLP